MFWESSGVNLGGEELVGGYMVDKIGPKIGPKMGSKKWEKRAGGMGVLQNRLFGHA